VTVRAHIHTCTSFLRMTSIFILRVLALLAVADIIKIELFNTDASK
jgi:hypothetical protein